MFRARDHFVVVTPQGASMRKNYRVFIAQIIVIWFTIARDVTAVTREDFLNFNSNETMNRMKL